MKALIISALAAIPLGLCAQDFETVKSIELSSLPNKSYVVNEYGKLLPGFTVTASSNGTFFLKANPTPDNLPSIDRNVVRTETILYPAVTDETAVLGLPLDKKSTVFDYVDGLGRKFQSVVKQGSFLQKDIISPFEFDNYGRSAFRYLPYVAAQSNGAFRANWSSGQEQALFYTSTSKIASDANPFAKKVFDDSPLNEVRESYGPGNAWQTNSKSTKQISKVDQSGTIYRWFYAGESTPPAISGTSYPVNALVISEVADEQGVISREYKDFRGLTILSIKDADAVAHKTYNIYDLSGRLRIVIPPEAANRISTEYASASSVDQMAFIKLWCFQYVYDDYGRMIKKMSPGMTDWTLMVYDKWDRLVLTREPGWTTNQWVFTKYDDFNRPIMSGIYTTSSTHATLQSTAMSSTVHHESAASDATGYTLTATFPTSSISESDLRSVTYYDNYNFTSLSGWDAESNSFTFVGESGFPSTKQDPVNGHVTGSKVRVLGTTRWLNTVTYYDGKYRTLQTIGENYNGGIDRITNDPDFTGRIMKIRHVHSSSSQSAFANLKEFSYDHGGRLLTVYQTIGSGSPVLLVANKYNEAGQLIEKNLHSTDVGASFLQSVDYQYNIRGWVTNINNSTFTNSGNNDDTNDLFGMDLLYNDQETIGSSATQSFYNGNISAIRWKTNNLKDTPQERIFGFGYDNFSRLTSMKYAEKSSSTWSSALDMFTESMSYDRNGNILTLNRNTRRGAGVNALSAMVDSLAYKYGDASGPGRKGNQLVNVHDGSVYYSDADKNPANGFVEFTHDALLPEYTYDASGRMLTDDNRKITGITYNYLNMPEVIQFLGSKQIEYVYDAAGNKLRSLSRDNGTVVYQTDYVGPYSYVNGQLAFVGTDEGRAVKNSSGVFEYEYFLKDHQGNSRVVFGSKKETKSYNATLEAAIADREEYNSSTNPDGFRNLTTTRVQLLNHTPTSPDLPLTDRSSETNGYLANKAIGPAKMLQVGSGDRVQIEVFARYNSSIGSNTALVSSIASAVTTGFGMSVGETAHTAMTNNVPGQAGLIPTVSGVAKAYVCYILFDLNTYTFRQFGYQRISNVASAQHERLFIDATMPNAGYLYVYVANESNVDNASSVYFDDLTIVHEKNNNALQVLQASDYYPFGLSFNEYYQSRAGVSSTAAYPQNKFQFQGQERQTGFDLGWYHFKYRMHDPAIGRFGMVDPLADRFNYNSPYAFSENILINSVELEGLESVFSISQGDPGNGFVQYGDRFSFGDEAYQLAGINQFVTNMVKNYPSDIFERMKQYDVVTMMVDRDFNYLGINTFSAPDAESTSRYALEDIHSLSSFYGYFGGKADESMRPSVRAFKDNFKSIEMGFEGQAGFKGLNFSVKMGFLSTAEDNGFGFFKIERQIELNNESLGDISSFDWGGKAYMTMNTYSDFKGPIEISGNVGSVILSTKQNEYTIGIGLGKTGRALSVGKTESKDLISRITPKFRIGH